VVSGDDEIKVKLSDGREFKGQVKGPVDLDGPGAHQD
jgi:S1-C subfamily serine protease